MTNELGAFEPGLFWRSPVDVAPLLLGSYLSHEGVTLRLVETEAYLAAEDSASHARSGPTARCATMFGPVERLYLYRSYGIHLCLNIVCHAPETGGAVLLRGAEVVEGESLAIARRGKTRGLADGPGKLVQCLNLGLAMDGVCLRTGPVKLRKKRPVAPLVVDSGPRIGITQNASAPYRFWLRGDQSVSVRRGPTR